MQETAYAKINLALHVRAREPVGYHRIETLFAFAEDGDALSAEPASELSLAAEGPFAAALGPDNLVLRAAEALRERFAVRDGAALVLDKRLPVASGIGGGSADAAAALRLLRRLWRLDATDTDLVELAATLGADVPACVASRTARGEGRGDRLTGTAESWSGAPVLLVNPRVEVSTAAVFKGWDGVDRGPLTGVAIGRNDLEAPAMALAPAIGDVLAHLHASGPTLARMSGSGATCFALYTDAAECDAAAKAIASAQPDWWQLKSRLR